MNKQLMEELCRKAGFCGSNLTNTVPGTFQITALENLIELVVLDCAKIVNAVEVSDTIYDSTYTLIIDHFGL